MPRLEVPSWPGGMTVMSAGRQGLPEKKVLPPTVPESPAFSLKRRLPREPNVEEVSTRRRQRRRFQTLT